MRQAEVEAARAPKPPKRPGRGKQPNPEAGYRAQRFLVEYLVRGTRRSADVLRAAQDQGISRITLIRAAKVAGVVVEPVRLKDKKVAHWTWRLGSSAAI
jgi:hypothetical protein